MVKQSIAREVKESGREKIKTMSSPLCDLRPLHSLSPLNLYNMFLEFIEDVSKKCKNCSLCIINSKIMQFYGILGGRQGYI